MTDGKHAGRSYMNEFKRRGASPVYQELIFGDDNLFIYDFDRDQFKEVETGDWVDSPGACELTGTEEECTWYQNRRGRWYERCVDVPTYTYVEADIHDKDAVKQLTWPELFVLKTAD